MEGGAGSEASATAAWGFSEARGPQLEGVLECTNIAVVENADRFGTCSV